MNILRRLERLGHLIRTRAEVFCLVGPSGTGKSFRAQLIAERHQIPYIIDDGLLIKGQTIVAGRSAKKEQAYVTAIKTAVFHHADHLQEVKAALHKNKVDRVLIIGTSDRMVELICTRLGLPPPKHIIGIEEVASKEEIALAQHHRAQGKHIIPVPTVMLKLHYPTMIAHKIRVFIGGISQRFDKGKAIGFEKSIVRPLFHKREKTVTVSERALRQMVFHCVDEFDSRIKVSKIRISQGRKGSRVTLGVIPPYGIQLAHELTKLQNYIMVHIERYAGVIVENVHVAIDSVSHDSAKGKRTHEKK